MEGLPLAIELTATRTAHLSPEIVLARLGQRLDVVTSGPRDLPYHQRTLRAAIAWSYDLLGTPERLLFERMSVFAGGCTFDALEAICNAREDIHGGVAAALEGLLQQSLVYRVSVGEAQEDRRFNMLEMLREYAAEQLAEQGDQADDGAVGEKSVTSLRRYHAEYYLALAEAAELQKWGAEQDVWLDRLECEHDNLREAIQWALDGGEPELAAALCSAVWNFWKVRGYLSEGRSWFDKVLSEASSITPRTLARALNGAGVLARLQGESRTAVSLHEQSLALFRELKEKDGIADCLNNLGVAVQDIDGIDRAEDLYQQSIEAWKAVGNEVGLSKPLHNLGLIAQARRDHLRAARLFRESLDIERRHKEKGGTCSTLYNLGMVLTFLPGTGNLEEAERCFAESLAMARELGNKSLIGMCLLKLGELSLRPGDKSSLAEAVALFEDGLAIHRELGDKGAIAYALNDLGYAALLREDWGAARSLFKECLRLSQEIESKGYIAMSLLSLAATTAAATCSSGDREEAESGAKRALQLFAASRAIYNPNLIPIKTRIHDATFDALRALLPQDEFEALQALGQQMSFEETIAFALAD